MGDPVKICFCILNYMVCSISRKKTGFQEVPTDFTLNFLVNMAITREEVFQVWRNTDTVSDHNASETNSFKYCEKIV